MTNETQSPIFFVLNGLYNGEEDVYAGYDRTPEMKDGWYFLLDDAEIEEGPFTSREEAQRAKRMFAAKSRP